MTTNVQDVLQLSVDTLKSLLWQYNEAETLESLMTQKQAWYDENWGQFWFDWYVDVFNIKTANSFGLSVWAIILNFPLVISNEEIQAKPTFGFGALNQNFNNGNFNTTPGSSVTLTTEQARIVLWLRAYQITSSGAIPEINQFLKYLFEEQLGLGVVYAFDNLDMTMTYIFKFEPPQALRYVLENLDILPRPSGVELDVLYDPQPGWGFGVNNLNFNNGNFFGS